MWSSAKPAALVGSSSSFSSSGELDGVRLINDSGDHSPLSSTPSNPNNPPRDREDGSTSSATEATAPSASDAGTIADGEEYAITYEVDLSDIRLGDVIGEGSFGKVYRGTLFGKDVAVKQFATKVLDEKLLLNFGKEIDIMCSLRHPNVILFMGACSKGGNLTIITELMPKGSVAGLLRPNSPDSAAKDSLSFKMRMKFASDAALGMNWLHRSSPPILHLDLKTANLLVDESWTVKVADFGLSKINISGTSKGLHGSPVYMSPEMLLGQDYDEKTDIYSFGMVLWELLTGEEPFRGEFSSVKQLIRDVAKHGKRPEIPSHCPPLLRDLLLQCWKTVPSERPPFDDMLKDMVFEKVVAQALIRDKNGCDLWCSFFLGKDVTTWASFEQAFYNHFRVPPMLIDGSGDTKIQCLKALVANDSNGVTIEDFSMALECFGPMEGIDVVDSMETIMRKSWFHGKTSTSQAEERLTPHKPGTYMVRFSSSPGSFTISGKNKQGAIAHYRIQHKAGLGYLLGSNEFSSLDEVIKNHRRKLYLRYPCPDSPYQVLFKKTGGKPLKNIVTAAYVFKDS